MIKKIKKKVKEYENLLLQSKEINKYINPLNRDYETNKLFSLYNKKINTNIYNNKLISKLSIDIIPILQFIKCNTILILAQNINFAELLLNFFSDKIKITLIVFNNQYIYNFLLLKNKFSNIDIYFISYNVDLFMYKLILKICNDQTFDTIIIDNSITSVNLYNEKLTSLGILLCDLLNVSGTFIQYNILPNFKNELLPKLINILYDQFNYHNLHDNYFYYVAEEKLTVYTFFDYKKNKLDDFLKKKCFELLELFNNSYIDFKYEYSNNFLQNINIRWNKILYLNKEFYETNKNLNQQGGSNELSYKNIKIYDNCDLDVIPVIIDDLKNDDPYEILELDYQPRCHWGQKKLLLSEIQFLTRILKVLKTKDLNDYCIIYIGSAPGEHLTILFKMFPNILWLLYDPAKYSKELLNDTNINKSVFVFNMFFMDETIKHAKKHSNNKKIIFISDIRVENKEISIIEDMRNQAYWGMELNSKFMLLKFRIPYGTIDKIPKNNNDIKLNPNLLINPTFKTNKENYMIYLKGDIYLQIYHPLYSGELRLYVEQKNNKYELTEYNHLMIERKIFNFNSLIRTKFICNSNKKNICNNIPLTYLNLIPGYDNSIECLMEYNIFKNYYDLFKKSSDIDIIKNIYDINFELEEKTNRNFYKCSFDTLNKNISKMKKNNIDYQKLQSWKNIIKVKINVSIKYQIKFIKLHKNILGDRYKKSLQYLKKNYDKNLLYYKLFNV